ncbi:hypothetical protein [Geobacter sp.]|uniref:hypothetical protein n=1 Tax=Geobacter sp. TaxID=46610 RepID=UPI0026146C62|nr:hypothetical protein [Geobacter sp.]
MEEALRWDELAARVMSFECATLVAPELEKQLIKIGRGLKVQVPISSYSDKVPRRVMHVLTLVNADGGHSVMLKRWIKSDPYPNIHSVVLLAQSSPVPETLIDAVEGKNGQFIKMNPQERMLDRAIRLREVVCTQADVVVLHTHPWEVIATVALADPGAPPVLLVNHAAHIFWAGASVSDLVLNCRYSSYEDHWTVKYRGIKEIMHLPIPISEPYENGESIESAQKSREATRNNLKIPSNAIVMLTVGIGSKYTPLPGIDFLQAATEVLAKRKNSYLIAVGPSFDSRWDSFRHSIGERVILIDKQPETSMPAFFEAADIYLEGFPFGSTTALLEAGVRNVPCVLAPKVCPAPFTSDGIALEVLDKPKDIPEYVKSILDLLDNEQKRVECGLVLAASIRAQHCGDSWAKYLAEVQKNIPPLHKIITLEPPDNVPDNLSFYWTAFSSAVNDDPLESTLSMAGYYNLSPRIDTKIIISSLLHGRGRCARHSSIVSIIIELIRPPFLRVLLRPLKICYKMIRSHVFAIIGRRTQYGR